MKGITILEKSTIYGPNPFGSYFLISGFISFTIGIILLFVFDYDEIELILLLLLLGTLGVLSGLFISIIPGAPTDKVIYTIRVEEKIDLNEFLNNYEIVEHEKYSNIYKIKGDIINND